jgi:hypothetical protein
MLAGILENGKMKPENKLARRPALRMRSFKS